MRWSGRATFCDGMKRSSGRYEDSCVRQWSRIKTRTTQIFSKILLDPRELIRRLIVQWKLQLYERDKPVNEMVRWSVCVSMAKNMLDQDNDDAQLENMKATTTPRIPLMATRD